MKVFKVFLVAGLIFSFSVAFAQMPGGNRSQMGGQNMNMGHFYGKVLETTTGKPLSAASIQLIQNKFDSVSKKRKDVIVGGMLTTKKGEFSLENLNIMAA